jgi:hypothetical protein
MGLVRKNVYLYDKKVSTFLDDECEDYNCFGEVSFFIVLKVLKWNKQQQLRFVQKLKKIATETSQMLKTVYGEECISIKSVFEWHKRFLEGLRKWECKNLD